MNTLNRYASLQQTVVMDSRIFTLNGNLDDKQQTSLKMSLNPPIYLDPNQQYFLGVIGVQTVYHIPNVETGIIYFEYGFDDIGVYEAI